MDDKIYIDSLERIIERHEKREKELVEALKAITDSALYNRLLLMQGRATGKTHFHQCYNHAKELLQKETIS